MKSIKKGFTLIEVIVAIVLLMIIASIFTVNFINNLATTRSSEYEDAIDKLTSASDAYVTLIKNDYSSDFDDIRLVIENDNDFTFITIDELEASGLLNEKNKINPQTQEEFQGVVKFTNIEGLYTFEYIDDPQNLITVVYDKNGADSISRKAQAFVCEDTENIVDCIGDVTLPEITRIGGRIFGWSTDYKSETSSYPANTPLKELLSKETFKIEDGKIRLYAITSYKKTVYLDTLGEDYGLPTELNCTVFNTTPSCSVTLPDYDVNPLYEKQGWSTNMNGNADVYKGGTSILVDKNITLYLSKIIKDFNLLVNKLNRISSTTVIPSNINIIFVLDVSGSMTSSNRLENLKKVAIGLVERMNLTNSTVSLIPFSSSSSIKLQFDQDRLKIKSEINKLTASGGTSFTSAISTANVLMDSVPNDKASFVIFVSDGISSISSSYTPLIELKSKAEIYAMGIGANADNSYLKAISSKPENYYTYNDSADDMTLEKFYSLFDDIVQNITILEGDGLENAISVTVHLGKLELGELVISEKYPLEIYHNESLVASFIDENEYIFKENGTYYFDVYTFAEENENVGLENMQNLRIKYFYKEDN